MARLTNVDTRIVSLVKRGAVRDPDNPTEPQRYLLWKSADHDAQSGADPLEKEDQMPQTVEELTAALAKAEQDRDDAVRKQQEAEEKLTKAQPTANQVHSDSTDDDDDDMEKADIPEAVRARIKKQDDEIAALRKSAEDAEAVAKAEHDLRVTREYIQKADEFSALPIDAEKFGPVLKAAAEKLSKDEYDELERVLKGADDGLAKSELFTEIGKSGEAVREAKDQVSKQEQRAEEIRKADPSLSKSDALAKAIVESRR